MAVRVRAESEHRAPEVNGPARGTARQLRPDEVDRLVERYLALGNIKAVANEFGLYRATVRDHLKRRNVPVRKMVGMTDEQITEAALLYNADRSSVTVGAQLGFSNHTILKALRSRGVEIRAQIGRGP